MTNRFLSGALCLMLTPAAVLVGCTAVPPASNQAAAPAQPRMAVYDCGNDGRITIENMGSLVRVYGPADPAVQAGGDGAGTAAPAPVELVAAPPGQRNRYGADGYALVLEGGEALWMDAGEPPLTCMR